MVLYAAYAGALCLDGPTLTNLELLESSTGSSEGSLLSCLDTCASAGLPSCCHSMSLALPTPSDQGTSNVLLCQDLQQTDFLTGAARW